MDELDQLLTRPSAAPRREYKPVSPRVKTAKRIAGKAGFLLLISVILIYTLFPFYWAIVSSLRTRPSPLQQVHSVVMISRTPSVTFWRVISTSPSGLIDTR